MWRPIHCFRWRLTESPDHSAKTDRASEHPRINRVTFLDEDNRTPFQIHTIPIGTDVQIYAQNWIKREQRAGRPVRSYVIECGNGHTRGKMVDRTAEEAKTANIEKMGEPLGTLFSALWQEVAVLHFHWQEYVELFGTKPERIDLLNRAAPHFFRMLQDELWESSLLSLARLTDQSNSQGKQGRSNLTIQALPTLVADTKLKDEVTKLVAEAIKLTEFCRDWRNRRIAHRDLKLALEQPTMPLAAGSRAQVTDALKAIANVLNALELHYCDSTTRYDLGGPLGGATSLLYVLDDGLREQEVREMRFVEGKPLQDDLRRRDL
jgi:AbiU2